MAFKKDWKLFSVNTVFILEHTIVKVVHKH